MVLSLLLAACGTPAPADAATILAAADAHDGAVDHVVHECTGCGLGMPGDPAHTAKHEGYDLQFCSETCQAGFEADPAKGVAQLGQVLGK